MTIHNTALRSHCTYRLSYIRYDMGIPTDRTCALHLHEQKGIFSLQFLRNWHDQRALFWGLHDAAASGIADSPTTTPPLTCTVGGKSVRCTKM